MTLKYSRILVAVDGSKEAEWAFKKAAAAASRNDAELYLAHVIDNRTFGSIETYDRNVSERALRSGEELLARYEKEAAAFGVAHIHSMIKYGSPKTVIPKKLATELNVDVIVCGATGLNAAERFILGSVSERIMRTAKCDVLVVRRDQEDISDAE